MNPSFTFTAHIPEHEALPEVFVRDVAQTGLAHVSDRCCRAPKSTSGPERAVESTRFIFTRGGVCEFHTRRDSIMADTNTVVMCSEDQPFSVTHPTDEGDDCTVVCFSPMLMADLKADTTADSSPSFAIATPQMQLLLRALYGLRDEPNAVDEIAIDLLTSLGATFGASPRLEASRVRAKTHASDREAVEAVRSIIATAPDLNLTLEELGSMVNVSPYHLARRFRALTTTSVHQYRLGIRFSLALERLAQGCDDLSDLAQCLGFASHSHLSAGFKRSFGATPSTVRTLLAAGDVKAIRELIVRSKIRLAA